MTGALAACGGSRAPTITVTPSFAQGESSTLNVTTNQVTVVSVPAAEAWEWEKVSGGTFIVGAASGATTAFTASGMEAGTSRSATYVCNVTINGSVYRSPAVPVFAARTA